MGVGFLCAQTSVARRVGCAGSGGRNRVVGGGRERENQDSPRRTFASILFALGEPHPVVMVEMGHTNVQMTLGIYAQALRLDDDEKERLVEMVHGVSAHEKAHGLISEVQAA